MTCVESSSFSGLKNAFAPPVHEWTTNEVNTLSVAAWRDKLLNATITRYEWVNVPESIDARGIELCMAFYGFGCFYESIPGVLSFAPATPSGQLDMYYNPDEVTIVPPNGFPSVQRRCKDRVTTGPDGELVELKRDAVPCFDNYLRANRLYRIELMANRLGHIDRVLDQNTAAQAVPWVGVASETARNDLKQYMKQLLGFEPAIVVDESFDDSCTLDIKPSGVPVIADSLMNEQDRLLNRFWSMIGIDNAFSLKKEREVAGEVDANDEQVYVERESGLRCRQKAAFECNALFGTDIQVRFSTRITADGVIDFTDEEV